jgi:signal transduction histidine kinase
MAKYEQDKFAQIVHGSVHSLFTATALKISLDPEKEEASIKELSTQLHEVLQKEPLDKDFIEGLNSIKAVWDGVASITIDCKVAEHEIDVYAAHGIMNIAREAFSNSVRHGKATQIELKVVPLSDSVEVLISDNGRLPKSRIRGLGSEIVSRYAGDWELNSQAGATILRARIPAVK